MRDGLGILPGSYGNYAMPQDFVDLKTGSDPYKLIDLLTLVNLPFSVY